MIRIIDNKKIDLTEDEYRLFEQICKSYDRPHFNGKDLFKGLFETDSDGIILFLKPPTTYTSMEVYMFMMSVMQHQHLRVMYHRVDEIVLEAKNVINQANDVLTQLKNAN